ncbi:MAG TPA: hypothetical protein VFQ90_03795 [Stellaceae bacterium]|jgi:hypothetical protein|nr:hypothetical protein [Stellaceae bacterium]
MKVDEELVMALPRKLVEAVILGLYDPVNQHLVKLAAFDFPAEARQHFRRELRTWFRKIQRLRMKPDNRTGSIKFYFDLLFDYPFGGVELRNMRLIMDEIADTDESAAPTKTAEQMVDWLRNFHQELAERLHNGEDVLDMIPE